MEKPWCLDEYQKLFEAELAAALAESTDEDADVAEVTSNIRDNVLPNLADAFYDQLAKTSNHMLRKHRRSRRGFVRRNIRRWREGFDLLERLIVISEETGSAINNALRPKAVEENDARFESLISNHARAVQVAREIQALMVAGFPDGALARWRTLHEIAVVSYFISHAAKEVAERYILHDHVASYRRALNYMSHHERANLASIEPKVIVALRAAHDEVINTCGVSMKYDYGWAAPAFNKARTTFADLEQETGLDHWRPRYKWSTINTHGAYRTPNSTLATSESERPVLLVGESNSGMTDPAHMTAISLNLATLPVITLDPNLDRLTVAIVMQRLSDEIGEAFWRLDQSTYEQAQKPKNRWTRIKAYLRRGG